MIKGILVAVEAADDDGHVPALGTLNRSVSVHNPLVAWRSYLYLAGLPLIVYVEGHLGINVDILRRNKANHQVLVVEVLTGPYLQHLLCYLARLYSDGCSVVGQRYSVHRHLHASWIILGVLIKGIVR